MTISIGSETGFLAEAAGAPEEARPDVLSPIFDLFTSTISSALGLSPIRSPSPLAPEDWRLQRVVRYRIAVEGLAEVFRRTLGLDTSFVRELAPGVTVEMKEMPAGDSVEVIGLPEEIIELYERICLKDEITTDDIFRTKYYPEVLAKLRAVSEAYLAGKYQSAQVKEIILNLCQKHFMLELRDGLGKEYVMGLLKDERDLMDADKLDEHLHKVFQERGYKIASSDLVRKASANNPMPLGHWDPAEYSVRSHLKTLEVLGRDVELLRMACPVVGINTDPQIDPLFLVYLQSLKAGQKHMYVNNISHSYETDKRRKSLLKFTQASLEENRAKTLQALSESEEYSEKFLMISLPHDSDFYTQKGTPAEVSSSEFMKQIIDLMTRNEEGFYLPHALRSEEFYSRVELEFREVLEKYFSNTDTLNFEQRRNFIQIAYSVITKVAIDTQKITHMNITCKDGVDRAMGSAANLMVYLNPLLPAEEILYIICLPATLNHARPPALSRTRRSLAAIKVIQDCPLIAR